MTNMSRTARELGINRTTLLRLLHALESERFIEPRSEGEGWRIGVGLITLTAQAFFSEDLVQTAVPVLTRLAASLTLSAHLGRARRPRNRLSASAACRTTPSPAISGSAAGFRPTPPIWDVSSWPICRANASIGFMPASICAPVTPQTAITPLQLRAQLDADRALGLAWSDGNYEPGISSVAAAIFDVSNTPVAAINVTGQIRAVRRRRAAGADRRRGQSSRAGDIACDLAGMSLAEPTARAQA